MRIKGWLPLLCCLMAPASASAVDIHHEKSLYRNILVYEENGLRCMKFGRHDTGRQTCISLSDPDALVFNPPKMLLSALYLKPNPKSVLVIGLGGGTVSVALQKMYPEMPIDCVEIDPAVVRVAGKFFDFIPGKKMNVFTEDGRVFVKRALKQQHKYDLIILDAFDNISVPEHMTTREFLTEVKDLLQPDGVIAANTFSAGRFHASESATYFAVFGPFYNLQKNNRVILSKKDGLPGMSEIEHNADLVEGRLKPFSIGKDWLLPLISTDVQWPENTRLLTDQYSPANLLNGL